MRGVSVPRSHPGRIQRAVQNSLGLKATSRLSKDLVIHLNPLNRQYPLPHRRNRSQYLARDHSPPPVFPDLPTSPGQPRRMRSMVLVLLINHHPRRWAMRVVHAREWPPLLGPVNSLVSSCMLLSSPGVVTARVAPFTGHPARIHNCLHRTYDRSLVPIPLLHGDLR